MAIDREELEKKAIEAASAEEVMEIVRAAGEEITAEEAKQFFETIQERKADKALSLDELDAVTGGEEFSLVRWGITFRDYSQEGCAATVEPGSDCWGTDGGCSVNNIEYQHMPNGFCPDCGRPYFVEEIYSSLIGLHRKTTCCNYCDRWSRQEWWDGGKPVN